MGRGVDRNREEGLGGSEEGKCWTNYYNNIEMISLRDLKMICVFIT